MPNPTDSDTFESHHAAAQRAEAATLWVDAAAAYEACLSHITGGDPAREAGLLNALGRCYWFDGQPRAAWRTLRRAITLSRDAGDAIGMARATADLLRIWGPPDRQRQMADEALAALGESEPRLRALLYLRTRRREEAMALAETHRLEDVLVARLEDRAWQTFDGGDPDAAISLMREAHRRYDGFGLYDVAANPLRGGGFAMMETGRLTDGVALATEALEYAGSVHLRFHAQLALMDLVGAAFARCDFAGCEALLARDPMATDFRADLFRMWMALHHGDIPGAMRLIVDPDRAGNTPTAVSQIHAAAAGMLHAAGHEDAARRALDTWLDVATHWTSIAEEAAAPLDCLLALGTDEQVAAVRDALVAQDKERHTPDRYLTLQGRGRDQVRGGTALRLGLLDEAMAHYRDGIAWADAESCPVDAARCVRGLGDVALKQGSRTDALQHFNDAAARFERSGAAYELSRTRQRMG